MIYLANRARMGLDFDAKITFLRNKHLNSIKLCNHRPLF